MKYGAAHVDGIYTIPSGSGDQFRDGVDKIYELGLRTVKVYNTQNFASDYPHHTWSSTPTNIKSMLLTDEYKYMLSMSFDTVIMTSFAYGNPPTNWWRTGADYARLNIEYGEFYEAAAYLLTQFNNSGKTFIFQNWEGDWAFMDNFAPASGSFVDRKYVDYFSAFLATRQRAISDARKNVPHTNVSVMNAVEVNRVLDVTDFRARRRIAKDIFPSFKPDLVSYSSYDSTIAVYGYGANQAAWEALLSEHYPRAIKIMNKTAKGVPKYVGEFGYPEKEILAERPDHDIYQMVVKTDELSRQHGMKYLLFWEVFDNETHPTYGTRGYWLYDHTGSITPSGLAMSASAAAYES